MNLPRPYFMLCGVLCVRLPEGGWRRATQEEHAELARLQRRLETHG